MNIADILKQLKAFARQDGAILFAVWTASFFATLLLPQSPWGNLLALSTPFVVAWRLRRFRRCSRGRYLVSPSVGLHVVHFLLCRHSLCTGPISLLSILGQRYAVKLHHAIYQRVRPDVCRYGNEKRRARRSREAADRTKSHTAVFSFPDAKSLYRPAAGAAHCGNMYP